MANPTIMNVGKTGSVSIKKPSFIEVKSKHGTIKIDKNLWKSHQSDDIADKFELTNGIVFSVSPCPYDILGEIVISSSTAENNESITDFHINNSNIDINSKNSKKDKYTINGNKSFIYITKDDDDNATVLKYKDSSIWFH